MRTLLTLAFLYYSTCAEIAVETQDHSINMRSSFEKAAKICNIHDEGSYCQQIVVDQRLNLAAISYKCECPQGWRCPSDISDTPAHTECHFEELKFWHRCHLRCTPVEVQ